jgi:hypothetical protein
MASELIMELTGESRVTQVQPPWGAWVNFFQFDPDAPAPIILRSEKSGERIERPIVRHDHNWTVEIPEAACSRPAIIRFRSEGANTFSYWIYENGEPDFTLYSTLLDRYKDASWIRGRRFLVLRGA